MTYTERAIKLNAEAAAVSAMPFLQKAQHVERIALDTAALLLDMARVLDQLTKGNGHATTDKPAS